MYKITVKWPDGRTVMDDGYTADQAVALRDFLYAAGADDVKVECACGECETCTDRATFENSEI